MCSGTKEEEIQLYSKCRSTRLSVFKTFGMTLFSGSFFFSFFFLPPHIFSLQYCVLFKIRTWLKQRVLWLQLLFCSNSTMLLLTAPWQLCKVTFPDFYFRRTQPRFTRFIQGKRSWILRTLELDCLIIAWHHSTSYHLMWGMLCKCISIMFLAFYFSCLLCISLFCY